MNELFNVNVELTSLDIAEITDKRHTHILEDVRKEIKELGELAQPIFRLGSYKDKNNQARPYYEFGKQSDGGC